MRAVESVDMSRRLDVCPACGRTREDIEATGVLCYPSEGYDPATGAPPPGQQHEPYVVVEAADNHDFAADPVDDDEEDDLI